MVTARDLTRNVTGMRGLGARDIHARVSPLVAGGWLLPVQPQPHPEYNTKWEVTPAVARQFEARKREEERQKTEVARLVNSPGRAVVDNVDMESAPVIDNPGANKTRALPHLSIMSIRVREERYMLFSLSVIFAAWTVLSRCWTGDTTVAIDNIDKSGIVPKPFLF